MNRAQLEHLIRAAGTIVAKEVPGVAVFQLPFLGLINYHAVPGNFRVLPTFRREVARAWLQALRRRSQRHRLTWERFAPIVDRFLPWPRILHPEPGARFDATHPR